MPGRLWLSEELRRIVHDAESSPLRYRQEFLDGQALIDKALKLEVGEIYLNSMDRDGTGQGLDLDILELLPGRCNQPIILAGGAGNSDHLMVGLKDSRVDAVATANLFNFVGDGLKKARQELVSGGIVLPMWDLEFRTIHDASRLQNSGLDE